ncbi:MAG: amidohydrolase family protein [Sphingomonadales bacterium]|nr:amidohydrolase family protein [Sphingomonadales bacterium]
MRQPHLLLALLIGLAVQSCSPPDEPVAAPGGPDAAAIEIRNVTVIDPESRRTLENRSVFIAADRIVAIEPFTAEPAYAAGQVIDGSGRYLIPGLMDMHAHIALEKRAMRPSLALLLANGVTGIRDPFGDCWEPRESDAVCIDDRRRYGAAIEAGGVFGPHILSLSSAIVRGAVFRDRLPEGAEPYFYPHTAAEARSLARYLKERGVDFIKTYNLIPREAYFALAEEANALGLAFAGHVPGAVTVTEAVEAGHKTIEHARVVLYDCSRFGPDYRAFVNDVTLLGPDADLEAIEPLPVDERLRRTVEEFDPELCSQVLAAIKQADAYYVPTHLTREMDARAGEAAYRNDPRRKYLAESLLEDWDKDLDRTAEASPERRALFRAFFDHGLEITRLAHEAGVGVMVGTDANDTMVFPGFAVHDEMAHFAKAGLAPMEILRAATTVPARYLEMTGDFGGIAVGKKADLVLLDANPLEDIANTRRISWVVFNGRAFDRTVLDQMLAAVEGFVASDDPAAEMVSLAIENVTVVDPETRSVLAAQTVFIDGDRIKAVMPVAAPSRLIPERTIDGTDKYLIPGLMDMHVHIGLAPWAAKHSLDLFIANGVTGVRDMLSDCASPAQGNGVCLEEMRELQAGIDAGRILGPRLLRLTSRLFAGPMIGQVLDEDDPLRPDVFPVTEEDGREFARAAQARGADLIKVSELSPAAAYYGMADEANRLGIEFSGHMPGPQTVAEVAGLGQRTIEHARELLYDCSGVGPALRESMIPATELGPGRSIWWLLIEGGFPMAKDERLGGSIDGFDPDRCRDMLGAMAGNGTYYVPTHLTRLPESFVADDGYLDEAGAPTDPRMKYIVEPLRRRWADDLAEARAEDPEVIALHKRFYEHGLGLTRLALEAGVDVMVGTDANDTMVFPGFAVHDEMAQFGLAGIAPMDILRAATTTPARYLGRTDDFGGVSAGKLADLVLLDADPLEDIANTQAIDAVIYGGRVFDRAALDGLLGKMARMAAGGGQQNE